MKTVPTMLALVAAVLLHLATSASAGTYTVLHDFGFLDEGANPNSLLLVGDTFYATSGIGTLFSINTNGSRYINYGYLNKGLRGESGLALVGTNLCGTLIPYNAPGIQAEIFSVRTNGSGYEDLLDCSDWGEAYSDMTPFVSGGMIYGSYTGTNELVSEGGIQGYGGVFVAGVNGAGFSNVVQFPWGSSGAPVSGVILGGDTLYGVAPGGDVAGGYGDGILFAVNTDGSGFNILHQFTGTNGDGVGPYGLPLLVGDTLYGTTTAGGTTGNGMIYAIGIDGAFTNLHSFIGTDGSYPEAGLTVSGSVLYGSTSFGGAFYTNYNDNGFNNEGTIFSINTDGTGFHSLYSFTPLNLDTATNTDGAVPNSVVVVGGTLYGSTHNGGSNEGGTIFSLSLTNSGGGSVNAQPTLQFSLKGSVLVVTWPTNATGYSLQKSTNLTSPGNWMPATDTVNVVGDQNVVSNSTSGSSAFLRLKM